MVTPTKQEIDKKAKALQDHEKKLDSDGRIKEKAAVTMLRSAIRQVWMRAPNKLAVLERARIPDNDPETRTKWLFRCEICGELFKQSDVEIDHKIGNNKFTEISDFESYWYNVLNVSTDGLQVLCSVEGGCHPTKTYMESKGCTWEEAVARKVVIRYTNKKVAEQKDILRKYGYTGTSVSNAEKREKLFTKLCDEGKLQ